MKDITSFLIEVIKTVLLAAIIVIPIRVFVFQPFLVRGSSMEPNYHQGDYLIVDQLSYRFNDPQRGDVIVFYAPELRGRRYIKRIVGLPGETIFLEDGIIYIKNGEREALEEGHYLEEETMGDFKETLDEDEFFVLGDNRQASLDSRSWGTLYKEDIIGKVGIQLSPFSSLAKTNISLIIK